MILTECKWVDVELRILKPNIKLRHRKGEHIAHFVRREKIARNIMERSKLAKEELFFLLVLYDVSLALAFFLLLPFGIWALIGIIAYAK